MVETPDRHPNSEVKHHWACLVIWWGTPSEPYVLNDILYIVLHVCTTIFHAKIHLLQSASVVQWLVCLPSKQAIRVRFSADAFLYILAHMYLYCNVYKLLYIYSI